MADKKKGCYNLTCSRYRKEHKYKSTDNYCTICGEKLIYVCAECFAKLEDTDEKICNECQKKHQEQRQKVKDGVGKIKDVAVVGMSAVPGVVKYLKSDDGKKTLAKGKALIRKKR